MKYKVKTVKGAVFFIDAASKGEAWATAKDCCDDCDPWDRPIKVKKVKMKKELIFAMCFMLAEFQPDIHLTLHDFYESICGRLSDGEKAKSIISEWFEKYRS